MAKHRLRRQLPYRPEQLFDLVLDVERYPRFVPGWEAARVYDRRSNSYRTDQVVRFKFLRQQIKSRTTFERPSLIEVTAEGGQVERFDIRWRFQHLGTQECEVELDAELVMTSATIQKVANLMSEELVRQLLNSFEKEAARRFSFVGPARSSLHFPPHDIC